VAAIRQFSQAERVWSSIKVDCSFLDKRILFHQAIVRIAPESIAAVRRAVSREYPTFAVITPDDVSKTVIAVSQDAMSMARLVAWLAMGGGLAVLIAIVAASRSARLREIAILATIGTPLRTIRELFTIEFAAIGGISAAIASLLTCALNTVVLSLIFQRLETAIDWRPVAATIIIAIVVITVGGWLPTFRLLDRKPMDILRGE
jgi:putative ABC transport system permease protein